MNGTNNNIETATDGVYAIKIITDDSSEQMRVVFSNVETKEPAGFYTFGERHPMNQPGVSAFKILEYCVNRYKTSKLR